MVQLILDTDGANISLPESQKGGYYAEHVPGYVDVEMVTRRIVREIRGKIWEVSYQYGYLEDSVKDAVNEIAEKGISRPIRCGFLPPGSTGALTYSNFFVTSYTPPKFMWSRTDEADTPVPLWGDFAITLRKVEPSD